MSTRRNSSELMPRVLRARKTPRRVMSMPKFRISGCSSPRKRLDPNAGERNVPPPAVTERLLLKLTEYVPPVGRSCCRPRLAKVLRDEDDWNDETVGDWLLECSMSAVVNQSNGPYAERRLCPASR